MRSKPDEVNRVTMPADMLEKIAATNDLTIADVVRLFQEALPEPTAGFPLSNEVLGSNDWTGLNGAERRSVGEPC